MPDRTLVVLQRDCEDIAWLAARLVPRYAERIEDAYRRPVWSEPGASGKGMASDPTASAAGATDGLRAELVWACQHLGRALGLLEVVFDWASLPMSRTVAWEVANFAWAAGCLVRLGQLGHKVSAQTKDPAWRKSLAAAAKAARAELQSCESALNRVDEMLDKAHPATISRPERVPRSELARGNA